MNFEKELEQRTGRIEQILENYLPKETGFQRTVIEAMNDSIRAGGKRLRPMLMEETYRMFGGDDEVIQPFMAAIEMIHTHSLIHDDLPALDNDQYRRGRKTTWVVYGEAMGILSGDSLLNYAYETACRAFQMGKDYERTGRAFAVMAEKTGIYGMLGGQCTDVEAAGKELTCEKLDFIYRLKTGALIEASMMIGAILAGAKEEQIQAVRQIAANVGMAFQIQDDILDVTSTTEELGKPVGSDAKNEKTTYVTLEGIDAAAREVERLSKEAIAVLDSFERKNAFLRDLILHLINRNK